MGHFRVKYHIKWINQCCLGFLIRRIFVAHYQKKEKQMRKTFYYPPIWQGYPFSLDMFSIFKTTSTRKVNKESSPSKSKFRLALGW